MVLSKSSQSQVKWKDSRSVEDDRCVEAFRTVDNIRDVENTKVIMNIKAVGHVGKSVICAKHYVICC